MTSPSTSEALRRGGAATFHSAWLTAPALAVAVLRAALGWPALAFVVRAAQQGTMAARGAGGGPAGLGGGLDALLQPRTLAIAFGLWSAGALAGAALRVAFLAGALPVLGGELAGAPRGSAAFLEGFAWGFPRLLGTALLALALDLLATLFATAVLWAVVLVALHPPGGVTGASAAALGAALLCAGLVGLPMAGLAGDAALARASLAGDRPARALAVGAWRVLTRPAAFLLAAAAVALGSAAVLGSLGALQTAALGLAGGAPAVVAMGPRFMLAALATVLGAIFELWRLGTVACLACAPGGPGDLSDRAAAGAA